MANAKILRFLPAIRPIFMILIAEGKSQQYLRRNILMKQAMITSIPRTIIYSINNDFVLQFCNNIVIFELSFSTVTDEIQLVDPAIKGRRVLDGFFRSGTRQMVFANYGFLFLRSAAPIQRSTDGHT